MSETKQNVIKREHTARNWNIALIVLVTLMGLTIATLSVLYAMNHATASSSSANLENVYQRSFYELVDNMNNAELKLSKLSASNDASYQKKLLTEINQTCTNAQNNIAFLPLSANGIPETTTFINQMGGYCESLLEGVSGGTALNAATKAKFEQLYDAVKNIKEALNNISQKMNQGYSLTQAAAKTEGDFNSLTTVFQEMKPSGQDYPTMIYDGPFSDSTLNKEIKGLNFAEVSQEQAQNNLAEILSGFDVKKVKFSNETDGKFQTYCFEITLQNDLKLYAEVTKKGGKLLTITSSLTDGTGGNSITKEAGITLAESFVSSLGLENMKSVWSEVLKGALYVNLTPVINNTIVYPELVKVKIDLATGQVIGFESQTYYTNHTGSRTIETATLTESGARAKVPSGYQITNVRKAIIPREYSSDVLTWEVTTTKDDHTYYFYFNAKTGAEENILRVVETDNGNLLM